MHEFEIDGLRTTSLVSFFDEFGRVVLPGVIWGKNFDALDDVLYGGFGTPEDGFTIKWRHSAEAREALGYAETARLLRFWLATSHPSNRERLERELRDATQMVGSTVFDWLVEIFRTHPEVQLVLE